LDERREGVYGMAGWYDAKTWGKAAGDAEERAGVAVILQAREWQDGEQLRPGLGRWVVCFLR
jgi:hypothetical protein